MDTNKPESLKAQEAGLTEQLTKDDIDLLLSALDWMNDSATSNTPEREYMISELEEKLRRMKDTGQ